MGSRCHRPGRFDRSHRLGRRLAPDAVPRHRLRGRHRNRVAPAVPRTHVQVRRQLHADLDLHLGRHQLRHPHRVRRRRTRPGCHPHFDSHRSANACTNADPTCRRARDGCSGPGFGGGDGESGRPGHCGSVSDSGVAGCHTRFSHAYAYDGVSGRRRPGSDACDHRIRPRDPRSGHPGGVERHAPSR